MSVKEAKTSAKVRPENASYEAFRAAQLARHEEWPEPETSELYQLLRRAAGYISFTVLHRKEPELARDTATKALLRAGQFKELTTFSSWFYRIAVNDAKMLLRTESRQKEVQLALVAEPLAEATTATAATFEGANLDEREKRLLAILQSGAHTESRHLVGALREFAANEGISLRTGRRVWRKLREKLKSHLNS